MGLETLEEAAIPAGLSPHLSVASGFQSPVLLSCIPEVSLQILLMSYTACLLCMSLCMNSPQDKTQPPAFQEIAGEHNQALEQRSLDPT